MHTSPSLKGLMLHTTDSIPSDSGVLMNLAVDPIGAPGPIMISSTLRGLCTSCGIFSDGKNGFVRNCVCIWTMVVAGSNLSMPFIVMDVNNQSFGKYGSR